MTRKEFTNVELTALNEEYQTIKKIIDALLSTNPILSGIQLNSVVFEAKGDTQISSGGSELVRADFTREINAGFCMCQVPGGGCKVFSGISDCSEVGLSPCS